MSTNTTVGQLMVNQALPKSLRDYNRVLNKKEIANLLTQLGEEHPDEYRPTLQKLMNVGRDVAYTSGSNSFTLKHLLTPQFVKDMRENLNSQIENIVLSELPQAEKNKKIVQLTQQAYSEMLPKLMEISEKEKNPFVTQVQGAGRGTPANLATLFGFDGLYSDNSGVPIPVPVLRGYSEGLTPAEYFIASFGARKGISDVQAGTADGGVFSKLLNQVNHRLIVTEDDNDNETPGKAMLGYPTTVDDTDNIGAYLAQAVGGYPRNTPITARILKELKNDGIVDILVRSPISGGASDGGLRAKDLGIREKGRLPPIGDYVGIAAAQAISEGVTQTALSSKHSGGVAVKGDALGGFKNLNAMVQVPKVFPFGATHAEFDGTIKNIVEAPQGGSYVYIGSEQHYIPPDRDIAVKVGDTVEAGDVLSSGLPNPATIVQHKGVGDGRKYFTEAFTKMMHASGQKADRRNIEVLARGLINHVQLDEEAGDYNVEDIVPYHLVEKQWTPRPDSSYKLSTESLNHYLEEPVLHYSIGTKVRPSVVNTLQKFKIDKVNVNTSPVPFKPLMVRAEDNAAYDPDWMTRMLGSGHKTSLLDAVHQGAVSDTAGTSYVPALAEGVNFGITGPTKGWNSTKGVTGL